MGRKPEQIPMTFAFPSVMTTCPLLGNNKEEDFAKSEQNPGIFFPSVVATIDTIKLYIIYL